MATTLPPPSARRRATDLRVASRTPDDWVDEPYTRFTLDAVHADDRRRGRWPVAGRAARRRHVRRPAPGAARVEGAVRPRRRPHQRVPPRPRPAVGRARDAPLRQAHGSRQLRRASGGRPPGEGRRPPSVGRTSGTATSPGARPPSLGSLLRAIEVPAVGGDTLWADMAAAYDCLDDDVKARIDGLTAVHDWWTSFGAGMKPEQREALRPDFPAVEHPVVRTHPETGRRTLYVNAAFTQHIVGMDADESDCAARPAVPPGGVPRVPVPVPLAPRRPGHLGQPVRPSTTRRRTTSRSDGSWSASPSSATARTDDLSPATPAGAGSRTPG